MPPDPKAMSRVEERLARRLGELRRARGMTLATLAELSGISVPHLSRLEKGDRQPSVAALLQLAQVYGMSLSQMVEDAPTQSYHLVRADDADRWTSGHGTYSVISGTGADFSAVEATYTSSKQSRPARHEGMEWLYVIEGELDLAIGDDRLCLRVGDAIQFDASLPHRIAAAHDTVRMLIISATTPGLH